jgi:hypothetical protein
MTAHAASAVTAGAFIAWGALALATTPAPSTASTAPTAAVAAQAPADAGARYVGSARCQGCHTDTYAGWSKTRMANVIVDPKTHPDAILPDLSKPDPIPNPCTTCHTNQSTPWAASALKTWTEFSPWRVR